MDLPHEFVVDRWKICPKVHSNAEKNGDEDTCGRRVQNMVEDIVDIAAKVWRRF